MIAHPFEVGPTAKAWFGSQTWAPSSASRLLPILWQPPRNAHVE